MIKAIKKEVASVEGEVPWNNVDDKWRAIRPGWTRRLRLAENVRELAACVRELHDALLTDKKTGLFMSGGPWENSLLECVQGKQG